MYKFNKNECAVITAIEIQGIFGEKQDGYSLEKGAFSNEENKIKVEGLQKLGQDISMNLHYLIGNVENYFGYYEPKGLFKFMKDNNLQIAICKKETDWPHRFDYYMINKNTGEILLSSNENAPVGNSFSSMMTELSTLFPEIDKEVENSENDNEIDNEKENFGIADEM